jgi:hypothetical protein
MTRPKSPTDAIPDYRSPAALAGAQQPAWRERQETTSAILPAP